MATCASVGKTSVSTTHVPSPQQRASLPDRATAFLEDQKQLQPPGLALAREQIVEQRDQKKRGQIHQHKSKIETSGERQFGVKNLAVIKLRLQPERAHPHHIK